MTTTPHKETHPLDITFTDLGKVQDYKTIEHKWKLFETRLDYAWKYFDFHAKQRTTMFNFFLLFTGLVINGYVQLEKENFFFLSFIVALAGTSITLIFVFLDRRNEELVHIAEDILESLEKDVIFPEYIREVNYPKRRSILGKMIASPKERPLGIILRQAKDRDTDGVGPSVYTHGFWLPVIQCIIASTFFILAIYSLCFWQNIC